MAGAMQCLMTAANHQFAHAITFVNQLSYGSEDITAHEFALTDFTPGTSFSERVQTFLDPKNALRVVRRNLG